MTRPLKIVLTGGPGGGKTTAADMISREFPDTVVALPETATLLFRGGFPRDGVVASRGACQRAIYRTQLELEEAIAAEHPDRVLLCDRGTLDGCAYWPGGEEDFFAALGTTRERELSRYDAVLFFESAAVGGIAVDRRTNAYRVETNDEAARLDAALRGAWATHPRLILIRHTRSFFEKVGLAIGVFDRLLRELAPALAGAEL